MRQQTRPLKEPAEKVVQDIRRATRKHYSAEEKIRIVLEGLRGEDSIAELCRREGIAQNLYYRWSKDFLEAGKKRLAGDTVRAATSDEVNDLRREAMALKEVVADCYRRPLWIGVWRCQRHTVCLHSDAARPVRSCESSGQGRTRRSDHCLSRRPRYHRQLGEWRSGHRPI